MPLQVQKSPKSRLKRDQRVTILVVLTTPLTTQNFVNYKEGEIYGINHTPERYKQKFLKPRTPIRNFYLTGQDIVSAGIGGAMFSGVVKASAMQGKNLVKKIYHSKK